MTTFIKTKFKISDYQTNIKLIIITNICGSESYLKLSTISDLESPLNFQAKEEKNIQIGPETTKLRKLDLCGPKVVWGKAQYRIWNPLQISKSMKK